MPTDQQIVHKLRLAVSDESIQDIILAHISQTEIEALEQTPEDIYIYHVDFNILKGLTDTLLSEKVLDDQHISFSQIDNKNWNEEWESSFSPIKVGDFCTVRATFHKLIPVGYDIIINPELAFGTGHHETTYMMIDQMSRIDFTSKKVFDYGCGTAILAILAEKLGASQILAIDYDEQSIHCAHDCLILNHSQKISLSAGTIEQVNQKGFDIILANINRNVLLNHAEDLYSRTFDNGLLLLSGLLRSDATMILEAFCSLGYAIKNICYRGEWISILLKK